jgi:hypothetical protein
MGFWIIYIHIHDFALFLCLIKDIINIYKMCYLTDANNLIYFYCFIRNYCVHQ